MMVAPRLSITLSFASGELSETTAVQASPKRRATHATDSAMLPELAVQMPCSRAAGSASRTALTAPLSLKAPLGWRFSSFR